MRNLIERLEKKGWEKREIIKAVNIIKNAKQGKSEHIKIIEEKIYWILLFIIIVANFVVSKALKPITMFLSGRTDVYFIIIVIGAVFGLLFEIVIRSIEHLERRHHLFLAFFIPATAFLNMLYELQLFIALVYTVSFTLPYIIYRFVLKKEYYIKG